MYTIKSLSSQERLIMTKKNIKETEVSAITLLNATKVNEYQWISASNGSLEGNSILILVIFDRDTEDYYLHTDDTKIKYFSVNEHDWPLDEGLNSLTELISSKINITKEDAEKCVFAARALIEDEADEIDEMDFQHTFDNELGDINPKNYFSNENEVINRVWMNISKTQEDIETELNLSTGLLEFDREALEDVQICAWSNFKV